MGFKEAMEDGIEYADGWYKIPCVTCGKRMVRRTAYSRSRSYVCEMCKRMAKGMDDPVLFDKKEKKFKNAVDRIVGCVGSLDEYNGAIETVHKTLHRTGWYGSTEEIMVAIELVRRGVRTIHQQKIGKYHVDFVLPDYKVLLEIDGTPYHNSSTLEREGVRDGIILLTMGVDWEMIRIDTGKINHDIRQLVPSIEAILKHRQAERKR